MLYVISDIHGEYELFVKLMDKIGFSSKDRLICCGDMIEKGDRSIALSKLIFSMPNVLALMGNHEYAFVKYYRGIMERSPEDFDAVLSELKRYFSDDGELLDWETVDQFESLPFFYESENFICVHSGVPLDERRRIVPLRNASPEQLVYDRFFKEPTVLPIDGKCVFFGHTPTINLGFEPYIKCYLREGAKGDRITDYCKIHLDTGTWKSRVLGCFRVDDCKTFYVTEQ